MHAASFASDPKHVLFMLARYHFAARMIEGANNVLEVGCGDGSGARIVQKAVHNLYGMDIEDQPTYPGHFVKCNILSDGVSDGVLGLAWHKEMDAVFALDVLEHIHPSDEDIALEHVRYFLKEYGVCIIGMPSLESQPYASAPSKQHHVNCKTEEGLRSTMSRHFRNVFMFGMNDATLHTGFGPMCQYRLALCTGKR